MAKKILCVLALMLALVCVLASCGCDHEWTTQTCEEGVFCTKCDEIQLLYGYGHDFGEWTWTNNCFTDGVKEKTCTRCGEKQTETLYARGYHDFSNWSITTEANCLQAGLKEHECLDCGKTETEIIPASHKYSSGICTVCNRGLINIILPDTPITVYNYKYNGSINETCKITDIHITAIKKHGDGTYTIKFSWAGEKTYDHNGNNYSSSVGFAYKLYDSEGYVVTSGSDYSVGVSVGEKFRDQEMVISYLELDPNETYTLEILNLG